VIILEDVEPVVAAEAEPDELRSEVGLVHVWEALETPEAVECELSFGPFTESELATPQTLPIVIAGGTDVEHVDGGRLLRTRAALRGELTVCSEADDDLLRFARRALSGSRRRLLRHGTNLAEMDEETRHGRGPAVTRTPRYTRTSKQSAAWLRATVVAPLLATVPAFALLAALMAAP